MLKIGEWNAGIKTEDYGGVVRIQLWRAVEGGYQILGPDLTVKQIGQGEFYDGPPTLRLRPEMLQALADALYKHGIHPQERRFSQEMDLVKAHLADMRRLVFKK